MICFIQGPEDERFRDLLSLCAVGVCGCRIESYVTCYHPFPELAQFWVCYQDGKPRCALCSAGGVLTVTDTVPDPSLEEELTAFFAFHGTPVLREDRARGVVWHQFKRHLRYYQIMIWQNPSAAEGFAVPDGFQRQEPADLNAAWHLVKECFGKEAPAQEDFIGDLSHRQRRGMANSLLLREENGAAAAFAATAAMTEHSALIGSVCTAPRFRHRGLGTCCTAQLLQTLAGRTVYLLRKPGELEAFYRRSGFENQPPTEARSLNQWTPDGWD